MSTTNFNFFERHVEKLALAVAAAGAGYMILLSTQALTIEPASGKQVKVADVEDTVSDAVTSLQKARDTTLEKKDLKVSVPPLFKKYEEMMSEQPLPKYLLATQSVPRFVPRQAAVVRIPVSPKTLASGPVKTPHAPAPIDATAVSWSGAVDAGAGIPPRDQDMVVIQATLPLETMAKEMMAPKIEERLPGELQQTILYRVETQRRERTGTGWGNWTPVKERPELPVVDWTAYSDTSSLQPELDRVRDAYNKIAQPDSYLLPDGRPVLSLLLKTASTGAAGTGTPAGGPGAGGVRPPFAQLGGGGWGGGSDNGNPAPGGVNRGGYGQGPGRVMGEGTVDNWRGGGGGPGGVPSPAPALAQAVQPGTLAQSSTTMWVVDDDVKAGREYEYKVRVAMYNPTFQWTKNLEDEAMRTRPLLMSEWTTVPNTVTVEGDTYFFVLNDLGGGAAGLRRISAVIYKRTRGTWFARDTDAQPGLQIAGTIQLPDHQGMEVSTGYTVVDVVGAGNDVSAILMNPSGELISQSVSSDRVRRETFLKGKPIWRPTPVVTTRPAPGMPGRGPGPGPGGNQGGPAGSGAGMPGGPGRYPGGGI